jgi:N-acetylmuramoyl-L-alanine amidase
MRAVRRGDRGKQVVDIQTRLRALGFDLGNEGADGLFGPKTEAAIKAFQQKRLLLVDGIVGEHSWQELVEAGYSLGDRLLYLRVPHLRGDDVLEIQQALNELGFDCGAETGIFGPRTEDGLVEFQRNTGVSIDGVVGEATLDQLRRLQKVAAEGRPQIPDRMNGYVVKHSIEGLRVMIDPGHGGRDAGRVGYGGLKEKDANLLLAREVEQVLVSAGAEPLLTHDGTGTPSLEKRLDAARLHDPDLFLCLHHDSHAGEAAQGVATFYFANGTYFSEAGKRLAGYIVDAFVRRLGRNDLHTHGRKYACLREVECPAIRVEAGYLSHPVEGPEAVREETLRAAAEAILEGINNYLARV